MTAFMARIYSERPPWNRENGLLKLYVCIFVEIQDDDNCIAMLYQAVSELPQPNRDTLACLIIHLQK